MKKEDQNKESSMSDEENKIILYTTDDGKSQVSLMSRDGRIWLNQRQMAELFAVTKMNISHHIAAILAEKELDESAVKSYYTTAADGKRYNVIYYALEAMKKRSLFPLKDMRRLTIFDARRRQGLQTRRIWRSCDELRMRRNDVARTEEKVRDKETLDS